MDSRRKPLLLMIMFWICFSSSTEEETKTIYRCRNKLQKSRKKLEVGRYGDVEIDDIEHDLYKLTIPEKFDSREEWPYCESIKTITDQGECGGCWAFSAASAMSDRFCISTNGAFNEFISIQDLLECCIDCVFYGEENLGGCNGGYLPWAFTFWSKHGIVTGTPNLDHLDEEGCKPEYEGIRLGIPMKICREECPNNKYTIPYKNDKKYSIRTVINKRAGFIDLRHIQAEIMLNGPLAVGVFVTKEDFEKTPPGAILMTEYNEGTLGHAVKIIGWDVIDGIPVWTIANSWGTGWCDEGFCSIRRGQNDFKIESEGAIIGGIIIDGKKTTTTTEEQWHLSGSIKIYFRFFLNLILLLFVFLR